MPSALCCSMFIFHHLSLCYALLQFASPCHLRQDSLQVPIFREDSNALSTELHVPASDTRLLAPAFRVVLSSGRLLHSTLTISKPVQILVLKCQCSEGFQQWGCHPNKLSWSQSLQALDKQNIKTKCSIDSVHEPRLSTLLMISDVWAAFSSISGPSGKR